MKRCLGCMGSYEDSLHACPHCGYVEGTMTREEYQLRPGIVLKGHYLLGKVLGYGGFGTTYLAWDEIMHRTVAIKEYLPTVFATRGTERTMVTVYAGAKAEQFEKGRRQFLEEARKLARFTGHECIVGVYDFFEENGTAYIVMEYLDGESLTDYLRRERRMTFDAALRIALPILRALQDVHKEGIIHRDVAPDNIRITKDGKVKLLDFGAAREASVNHSHSLSVIYKPGYAPEEQYQSRGEQGPWTDVYALAATFYRMITGTKPAPALERLVNDTLVPPSELGVRITKNQETALLNALNVRRENRTQSAEAFMEELQSDTDVARITDGMDMDSGKKGRASKICLGVFLILILLGGTTFGVCKALGIFNEKRETMGATNEVRVPSFVNCTRQQAQELAEETNLFIEVIGVEYSADIPKDLVLKQNIRSGKAVEEGTTIELVISGGIKQILMQEVMGLPAEVAIKLLTEQGFTVDTEEVYSIFQKGNVVESNLRTGELYAEGTKVVLMISLGPDETKIQEEEFVVQNYVEGTIDGLQEELENHGISVNVKWEYSDTVAKGCIISQDIEPGTCCKKGTTIGFVVSQGKEMVTVPDCVFRNQEEAGKELEALGLKVTVTKEYSDSIKEGGVIRQKPVGLTEVEKGSAVELVVSRGKEPTVTVPLTKAPATKKPKPTDTPIPCTPTPVTYVNIHKAKVGGHVYFGKYEQDGNTSNGKEPIEWMVLATERDKVLLVSDYCLDSVAYNEEASGVVWSDCSMRDWLHNIFYYNAFSFEEQGKILSTEVQNINSSEFGTNAGEDTTDYLFVLSESEIEKYFKGNGLSPVTTATKYAKNQGVAPNSKGKCAWWLRTPGNEFTKAVYVQDSGALSIRGGEVQLTWIGVRPAMWVKK